MNKVPNLRFQEFSGEWISKIIGDLGDVTKLAGFEFTNHVTYSDSGEIIALRGLNVKNGKLILDDVKYIDNSDFSKLNRSKLIVDDLLFTYVGTVGETALIDKNDKYYLAPNVSRIRFDLDKSNSKFMHYNISRSQYFKKVIQPTIATSSQPALSMGNIRKLSIYIPSKEEQDKIASFFSLIDKKIELQTEKVEELNNYKKGIMQKIFSQELRFKDENGNEYPEWEKRRLQTIVEKKIKGKNPLYSETGNVLLNNEFMENNTEPLFVENEIDVTKKDILILWDGSQAGKVYTGFEGVLGSTFVAITLNKNNCNIFIQEQLEYNLNEIQHAWREGSGVPHVAKDFIENYKIFVPCYEEQSKISKMLLNINEKIKLEEKKLQYIKELKKGLLQQMFI